MGHLAMDHWLRRLPHRLRYFLDEIWVPCWFCRTTSMRLSLMQWRAEGARDSLRFK
eukprot:m.128051 g.128051  ORF g.128051 m.128051 type:complete len:56 (+) comp14557_c0_seq1:559-726(+)